MDGWIVIPRWDEFQHYKDRQPVWIKVYLELADNEDWVKLTLAERGLLVSLWVEFGSARGQLPLSAVPARVRQKVLSRTIESLADAGFIDIVASKPLALSRARAQTRAREEVREEKKKPARTRARKAETPQPDTRSNVQPADPVKAIEAMIRNGVIHDEIDLEAEIAGYHLNGDLAARLMQMLGSMP